jgi:hypothetical protein
MALFYSPALIIIKTMKTQILALVATVLSLTASAQKDIMLKSRRDSTKKQRYESKEWYIGPGVGLDYIGIGLKLEYMPVDWIGVFASAGTNFRGGGFNVGLAARLLPNARVTPFCTGMYGYNGAILYKGLDGKIVDSKNYNGFSFGGGLEFILGRNSNRLAVGILAPKRSQEFKDEIEASDADALPVAISIGFKFSLF